MFPFSFLVGIWIRWAKFRNFYLMFHFLLFCRFRVRRTILIGKFYFEIYFFYFVINFFFFFFFFFFFWFWFICIFLFVSSIFKLTFFIFLQNLLFFFFNWKQY